MAVGIEAARGFTASKPRVLFKQSGVARYGIAEYDVSPDGQRFLMIKESEAATPAQLNVVVNWSEELKGLGSAGVNK